MQHQRTEAIDKLTADDWTWNWREMMGREYVDVDENDKIEGPPLDGTGSRR